jgi:hypothetical protein
MKSTSSMGLLFLLISINSKLFRAILNNTKILICSILTTFIILQMMPKIVYSLPYDATKTITWTFNGKPVAATLGHYKWELNASAKDNHINKKVAKNSNAPNPWQVINGLPKIAKTTGLVGGNGCPNAQAEIEFEATQPIAIGNLSTVSGLIHVSGFAKTVPKNPGNHTNQKVSASSYGKMQIAAAQVSGMVIKNGKGKIKVKNAHKFKKGAVEFKGFTTKTSLRDPVSIQLEEFNQSGEKTATYIEQLFSLESNVVQNGELTWDETNGIILDTPLDNMSSVSILGGFDSAWILSEPDPFSASLSNGEFNVTGAFSLPNWELTYNGLDVVCAKLAPEYIPELEVEYAVPSLLVNNDFIYRETLLIENYGSTAAAVPEPSTCMLFFFGLMGLVVIKKRLR